MRHTQRLGIRVLALVVGISSLVGACSFDNEKSDGSAPETAESESVPLFQPAAAVGADSFSPSMNTTVLRVDPSTLQSGVAGPDAAGLYSGPTYGGTGKQVCDVEKMIAFLTSNPDRGREWARVQGIQFEQLPAFLRSLTPVYLQQNIGLTMFGFKNGAAYGYDAVLEAGTAVLVDDKGLPRARCACGNPLIVENPPGEETTTTSEPQTSTTVTIEECPENPATTDTTTGLRRRPRTAQPGGEPRDPDDSNGDPYYDYPYDEQTYDYPYDNPPDSTEDPCVPCPEDDTIDYPGYSDRPYDNYPNGGNDYYYDGYNDFPYDYPRTDPEDPCSPYVPPSVFSDCLPLLYSQGEQWLDVNTGSIWVFNGMVNGEEEWSSNGRTVYGVRNIPGYPWEKCAPPIPNDYPCPPEQPMPLDRYVGDPSEEVWTWVKGAWYRITDDGLEGGLSSDELPGIENCGPQPNDEPTPSQPGEPVECPEREAPAGTLYEAVVNGVLVTYESLGVTDLIPDDWAEPYNYSAWRSSDFAEVLPTFALPGYAERCQQLPLCPSSNPTPGDLIAITDPDTGNRVVFIFVLSVVDPAAGGFDETFGTGGAWLATWGAPGQAPPSDPVVIYQPVVLEMTGCLPPCPPLGETEAGLIWISSIGEVFTSLAGGRWTSVNDGNSYDSAIAMPGFVEDCGNPCANTDRPTSPSPAISDVEDGVPEGFRSSDHPVVYLDSELSQGDGAMVAVPAPEDDIMVNATNFDFCDPDACPPVEGPEVGSMFLDSQGRRWYYDGEFWRTFFGDEVPVESAQLLPGYERCLFGDIPRAAEVECPSGINSGADSRVTLDDWPGVEWVRFTDDRGRLGWGRVNAGSDTVLDQRSLSSLPFAPCIPVTACPQLRFPVNEGAAFYPSTEVGGSDEFSDGNSLFKLQADGTWVGYGFDGSTSEYRDVSLLPTWIDLCYQSVCAMVTAFEQFPGMIFLGSDGFYYRNVGGGLAVKLVANPDAFIDFRDRFVPTNDAIPLDSVPGLELCGDEQRVLYSQRLVVPTTTTAPTTTKPPISIAPTTPPTTPAPVVTPPATTTTTVVNPEPVITIRSCSWSASGFDLTVSATDNTGIQNLSWTFNGQSQPISKDGELWYAAIYNSNVLGNLSVATVVVTATDTQGKVASKSVTARKGTGGSNSC